MARTISGNPHTGFPPTPIRVEVKAKTDRGGRITYTHSIRRAAKKAHAGPIKLRKNSGPYVITFDLDTQLDLRFDAASPFFCDTSYSGVCPTSIDRLQIMVVSCSADELVVIDWNYGAAADLHYQLNFTNKFGVPKAPYDPIIINGGGIKSG